MKELKDDYIINEFIKDSRILTAKEEKDYFIRYKLHNDSSAKQELLKNNVKLVLDIYFKQFSQYAKYQDDLLQEGLIALNDAIDRFDINKNQKLSTYAEVYISGYMKRYLTRNNKNIRMSFNKTDDFIKIKKIINNFSVENYRKPTIEELSELTNLSIEKIKDIYESIKDTVSLNNIIKIDDDTKYEDIIDDNYNLEEEFLNKELKDNLNRIINMLPKIEKNILHIKFGFYDGIIHSNKETANILYKLNITDHILTHQAIKFHLKKIECALNSNIIRTKIGLEEIKVEPKSNKLRKTLIDKL